MNKRPLNTIRGQLIDPKTGHATPHFQRVLEQLQSILGNALEPWENLDKTGSELDDIEIRPHSQLQDVGAWTSGTNTTKDKHISQADGKAWEDHRNDATIHHTLEQVQDSVAGMLAEGNAVTLTYDDAANTLTVAVVAAEASADATVTVTGTATGTDAAMVNALKVDVTALKNSLNDLKAKMRTAGTLAI